MRRTLQRGSVLIMVTLALFAMFGLIGLAVDFGWAFFLKRTMQAAADAAALAAVRAAMDTAGPMGGFTCGAGIACLADPTPCGAVSGNLQEACVYASQNGFSNSGRQTVTVQASDRDTPPTVAGCSPVVRHPPAPPNSGSNPALWCVDTQYWVTVRISETVPQLFSAILGHTTGTVSARATAAVTRATLPGSLILTNRKNDVWSDDTGRELTGTNLYMGGSPKVTVPGGTILSSNDDRAGWISGGGRFQSPDTYLRSDGDSDLYGPAESWRTTVSYRPDGSSFHDPMTTAVRTFGQPPVNSHQNTLPLHPVFESGPNRYELTAANPACSHGICEQGNYFAVEMPGGCTDWRVCGVATGAPITVAATLTFGGSGFSDFAFFGGLVIGGQRVTFGAGRFIMAGVNPDYTTSVIDIDNRAWVTGGSGENDPNGGRIFILTDSSYDGMLDQTAAAVRAAAGGSGGWTSLEFGKASFKSGNNNNSRIVLYGLDPEHAPEGLDNYGPVLFWQDQENSTLEYTAGDVDLSCGGRETPCASGYPPSDRQSLEIWASQFAQYGGIMYQPRGAWTLVQANNDYNGPLMLIAGGLKVQGSSLLTLGSLTHPFTTFVVALVG